MFDPQPEQLAALAAVVETGTFDGAAKRLSITPSAVSQRMRALESEVGAVVVRRSRPVQLTEAGQVLLRLARQQELVRAEALRELSGGGELPAVPIVVNSDSLSTWALEALATVRGLARLEVLREDQDHSVELLRDGTVVGAVTSTGEPVPGCTVRRLGSMRYRPLASPEVAATWFAPGAARWASAPVVVYDRKDDMQHRWLRRRTRSEPDAPITYVPSAQDFVRAVELGFGWGMVPDLQAESGVAAGRLVRIDGDAHLDLPLFWQQWRLRSTALDAVGEALAAAAARVLV